MTDHGSKLSRGKVKAIDALIAQPSVADAALVAGIGHRTLLRWMQEREFAAAYRAAKRAEFTQSMARIGQGAVGALKSIIQIMYNGKKPALRLKAARAVIRLAREGNELEDLAAAVEEARNLIEGSGTRIGGHGAKLPRKREKAIASLLARRSVAEAAGATGIGTESLYRWMRDPAFLAEYAAQAVAVFAPALKLAQERVGDAGLMIRNFSVDTSLPEATRLRAALYVADALQTDVKEDLESRTSEMDTVVGAESEPAAITQTFGGSLRHRLERIKACLRASEPRRVDRIVLIRAADGKPAGPTEVLEADGRRVPGEDQSVLLPEAS